MVYICFPYILSTVLQKIGGEGRDIFELHCTSVRLALLTAWNAGWRNHPSKMPSSWDRAVPPSSFSFECANPEVLSHWALIQLLPCKNRSSQFYVLPNNPSISSIQDTKGTEEWDIEKLDLAQFHRPIMLEEGSSPKMLSGFFLKVSPRMTVFACLSVHLTGRNGHLYLNPVNNFTVWNKQRKMKQQSTDWNLYKTKIMNKLLQWNFSIYI